MIINRYVDVHVQCPMSSNVDGIIARIQLIDRQIDSHVTRDSRHPPFDFVVAMVCLYFLPSQAGTHSQKYNFDET